MTTKNLKYVLTFFYLNIFTAELPTKEIINKLTCFFLDKKSNGVSYCENIKKSLLIGSLEKDANKRKNEKKASLYRLYNYSCILKNFTESSELFSEKFKKWVGSYILIEDKCLKTISKTNILDQIFHPDKGETTDTKYIHALKIVLLDLTDLIVDNKKADNKEMEQLLNAFYSEDLNLSPIIYFSSVSLLFLAAGVYNFYKNNNNKKALATLILLEIFAIAFYHQSQYKKNSKQNQKKELQNIKY